MFDRNPMYYSKRNHLYQCDYCGYKWTMQPPLNNEAFPPSRDDEDNLLLDKEELISDELSEEEMVFCPMCGNVINTEM